MLFTGGFTASQSRRDGHFVPLPVTRNRAVFRFTVRELLMLTVVVAVGAAGWINHLRQLAAANSWRTVAGAMEEVLKGDGWTIRRGKEWAEITRWREPVSHTGDIYYLRTDMEEPSELDPTYTGPPWASEWTQAASNANQGS